VTLNKTDKLDLPIILPIHIKILLEGEIVLYQRSSKKVKTEQGIKESKVMTSIRVKRDQQAM
jgi:hypothetical protein